MEQHIIVTPLSEQGELLRTLHRGDVLREQEETLIIERRDAMPAQKLRIQPNKDGTVTISIALPETPARLHLYLGQAVHTMVRHEGGRGSCSITLAAEKLHGKGHVTLTKCTSGGANETCEAVATLNLPAQEKC